MDILVTGGAGYIGTTLVPILLDRSHRVRVFDSLRYGVEPILPFFRMKGFDFVKGDIRDADALGKAGRGADLIIHLAAIVGYPACEKAPQEAQAINVTGTANVAELAGKTKPVIFASTSSCYGAVADGLCTEDTPLNPLSLYGTSKAQGEQICLTRCNSVVYRLATAYGVSPRQRLDLLVNDFVYRAVHDRRLVVYEGHARRSFIHVFDIAWAICLAVDSHARLAGNVYNVGDVSQNFTKLQICEQIREQLPYVTIEADPAGRDKDQRDYAVSYSRIREEGFRANVSLSEGIRELAAVMPWIQKKDHFANV